MPIKKSLRNQIGPGRYHGFLRYALQHLSKYLRYVWILKTTFLQGIQLHQDDKQNLWATRLGKNPVYVRGYTLCPELVKLNGKLTQGVPMKVLDTASFKQNMREECENSAEGITEELTEKIYSRLKVGLFIFQAFIEVKLF